MFKYALFLGKTKEKGVFDDEIALLASGIGFDEWDVLVNGLASMSETGVTSLGEGYSITLVNPHNEENILLWVMDGVVMYDVADDLR